MFGQYQSHPGTIRGAILGVVREWSQRSDLEADKPFKKLRGKWADLFELEIDVENKDVATQAQKSSAGKKRKRKKFRNFRILGFKGPVSGEYTLLTGFEKTQGVASYNRPGKQAIQRIRKLKRHGELAPNLPI